MAPGSTDWFLLQHVEFEGPGLLAPALERRGVRLRPVRVYAGDPVPVAAELDAVTGVLSMGGPMNALDDAHHPNLPAERALLAAAANTGRAVLGVCLGAQLLAAALGAPITTMPAPELGVGTVDITPDGRADPAFAAAGAQLPVVHWHGDTFAVPDGATLLASSAHCSRQAFRWGERAYGLQFHVEMTSQDLRNAGADLPSQLADHERLLPPGQPARAGFVESLAAVLTETPGPATTFAFFTGESSAGNAPSVS